MLDLIMPSKVQIYIELKSYFDDEEYMKNMDDEDLFKAYSEMKFLSFGLLDPEDLGWEEV